MDSDHSVPSLTILALFAWVVGSTVLGRAFTAICPGGSDAQLFAYIGGKWLAGQIPYLDIWDNKPPGIFLVNALVFSFAPKNFTALSVVEGVFIIGCIGTVYAIMRKFRAPMNSVVIATAACAISSNLRCFNEGGNLTEIYVLWPAALSILMFARALPELRARQVAIAGMFAGIATSFKLTGLAPLLAQLTFLLLGYCLGKWPFRTMVHSTVAAVGGFLLAWLPWLVYFYSKNGTLELIKVSFAYPFLYGTQSYSRIPLHSIPFKLGHVLSPIGSLVLPCFVGIGLLLPCMYKSLSTPLSAMDSETPENRMGLWAALTALWFIFDISGALAGGRFYPHYFLAITASLPIMLGISYWHTVERVVSRIKTKKSITLFVTCAILGSALFSQGFDIRKLISAIQAPRHAYSITEYLNNNKEKDTKLFTWNYLPRVYFETGLMSPHKLTSSLNLRDSPYMRRAFTENLLSTLEYESPTFIIDGNGELPGTGLEPAYKRFRELIDKKYELVKVEGRFRLYRKHSLDLNLHE
jgi:hypothetical protein